VVSFVEAELNRRFPPRRRCAADPAGLHAAWAALERAWAGMDKQLTTEDAGSKGDVAAWSYGYFT